MRLGVTRLILSRFLLLAITSGVLLSPASFLCVAPGGHVALEAALTPCGLTDRAMGGATAEEGFTGCSQEKCSSCVDIPLSEPFTTALSKARIHGLRDAQVLSMALQPFDVGKAGVSWSYRVPSLTLSLFDVYPSAVGTVVLIL